MDEQNENDLIASVENREWKSVADFAAIKRNNLKKVQAQSE